MSRSTRKQTLWTLRKVSTRSSLSMPRRLTLTEVDFLFQESWLSTSIPMRRSVSAQISLRGLRRLIWVDTLRVHNAGYLVQRSYDVCGTGLIQASIHICLEFIELCFSMSRSLSLSENKIMLWGMCNNITRADSLTCAIAWLARCLSQKIMLCCMCNTSREQIHLMTFTKQDIDTKAAFTNWKESWE